MSRIQRKKGPPSTLRIDMPPQSSRIAIALGGPTSSTSATSDSDFTSSPRPRSLRNMKKLSLNLPSAQSSSLSLGAHSEPQSAHSSAQPELPIIPRPRRPSVISLPPASANSTVASFLHRKEQEGDPAVPYADGPTQIIPGIWLGSEENARDWNSLISRGIKSILNVAKEVASPFDSTTNSQSLRSVVSTPNLNKSAKPSATYYPPNPATGRPGLHYLKLQWSHGQQDLVADGFPAAMAFTDEALARGDGVLIHCQCGISRSATLVIALVMRAAAERSPSVPSEIWALKGMQPAYDFVKQKSKWIGPNMSLIYQLLDYERKLKGSDSPSSDRSSLIAEEEAEWSRRRRLLDEMPSDDDEGEEHESRLVLQEAQALDKAMEDRIVARKASASSLASHGSSTGVGMGAAWRSRYSRKRTGSIASNMTNGSVISEDLVEEEEEQELLGVGGGFESDGRDLDRESGNQDRAGSTERDDLSSFASASSSTKNSPEDHDHNSVYITHQSQPQNNHSSISSTFSPPKTARPRPHLFAQSHGAPPSAPVWKTSFGSSASLPAPSTAFRPTFDLSSTKSHKRRPPPLGVLPPVPPSPIAIVVAGDSSSEAEASGSEVEGEAETTLSLSPKSKSVRTTKPLVLSPAAFSFSSTSSSLHKRRPLTSLPSHSSPAPLPAPAISVVPPTRLRTESRKPAPPPLHLRNSIIQKAKEQEQTHSANAMLSKGKLTVPHSQVATPSQSQTLFVFPPSPTLTTRTPSTMTLTSATTPIAPGVPFPMYSATPRVSTFRGAHGKTRSFIGLGAPPTPTTGFSRVDARGYVALE